MDSARFPVVKIVSGFQRAGSAPLRPLPFVIWIDEVCRGLLHAHEKQLDRVIFDTLCQYGFYNNLLSKYDDKTAALSVAKNEYDANDTCWFICSRSVEETQLTVLIITPWNEDQFSVWEQMLAKLQNLINHVTRNTSFNVSVEMCSVQIGGPNYISSVADRPDLDRDWESIKETVRRILEQHESTAWAWNVIALFRLGQSQHDEENPATVYITMSPDSEESHWRKAVVEIECFLKSSGHNLGLHMAKYKVPPPINMSRPCDSRVDLDPCKDKVSIGADVGASCTEADTSNRRPAEDGKGFNSIGTVTCYIQIQDQTGKWKLYGLTNYHVIRCAFEGLEVTADDSVLRYTDIHGFKPGDRLYRTSFLESPSRGSYVAAVAYLEHVIKHASGGDEEWQRSLEQKRSFFDAGKQFCGRLYAGSGLAFRTPENGMLDWALFEVLPSRLGTNTLPSREIWPRDLNDLMPPETACEQPLGQPSAPSDMGRISTAYKVCAATRATTGTFSRHKAYVRCTELGGHLVDEKIGRATAETAFVSKNVGAGPVFAQHGDCGSLVYDGGGRAVGQLFNGQVVKPVTSLAFATPMEYVLAHIAEFLGLPRSAVRIAEF
ncbi:hypothetical protein PWT90_07426 [Aphanocladium album]|nr:hypothetical protein PWT90_07426 [Aphanocladium album]